MDAQWLLTLLPLLLSISISYCKPEKLRINPDDVAKAMEFSNLTHRDKTEKVMFAWKVTMKTTQTTTTDPRHTSTLTEELHKKNNEIYDKLFAQLAYTLRDKVYLDRWLAEMDKGYHIFLYEIQKRDKYYFFKRFEDDDTFEGSMGSKFWGVAMDFLSSLQNKDKFCSFIKQMHEDKQIVNLIGIRNPTASEEQRGDNKAYRLMNVHFANTFGDVTYKTKWIQASMYGFKSLIEELKRRGPKFFIKLDPADKSYYAAKGGLFWDGIINFIEHIGQKGLDNLMLKALQLPQKIEAVDIHNKKYMHLSSDEMDVPTSPCPGGQSTTREPNRETRNTVEARTWIV